MKSILSGLLSFFAISYYCCAQTADLENALQSITEKKLVRDISVLSSDEFEGRRTGTPGEDLAVSYIARRFKEIGLEPVSAENSYFQEVPLTAVTSNTNASIEVNGSNYELHTPDEFAARSFKIEEMISVKGSELVFAGYGIEAPEYNWNDYHETDVKGKTVFLLRYGEPSRYSSEYPAVSDTEYFRGEEPTVHGNWRYKRELAFSKGAAAVIFIGGIGSQPNHEFYIDGYLSETLGLAEKSGAPGIDGSIQSKRLRELFNLAGYDLDSLYFSAQRAGFRAVPLNMSIDIDLRLKSRLIKTRNVIGLLRGSDEKLKNEYIIYSSHWDGKGRDTSKHDDQILNGALDNAIGVAQIMQIADAMMKLPERPKRSVIFFATAAEEFFFLGARYYVQNPLFPLENTIANVNLDISYPYGKTSDVIIYGDEQTQLRNLFLTVEGSEYKTITHDPFPSQGFNFRMDHIEFFKAGIPAVSPWMGINISGMHAGLGKKIIEDYFRNNYHKPSDELNAQWDLSGAVQYTRMCLRVGLKLAEEGL